MLERPTYDSAYNYSVEKLREQGITEQLKSKNQIAWVGAMNNIRSAAEEQVCCDLIFS